MLYKHKAFINPHKQSYLLGCNIIFIFVYRVLAGKPEGKRPLGRPRRIWVDNIRMDLQEVGCGYVD